MRYLKQIATLVRKDVSIELRTKSSFISMFIFAVLTLVIFNFAFEPDKQMLAQLVPGILWVVLIFAGFLGLNRSIAAELNNGCLQGLALCTLDKGIIYLGKVVSNLLNMLALELLILPGIYILYEAVLQQKLSWDLVGIVLLGTWGFVALGTFLAFVTVNAKSSELLLPVLLFPLLIPLLIAVVRSTAALLSGGEFGDYANWLYLLISFDLLFTVVPWLLVDYVLEV